MNLSVDANREKQVETRGETSLWRGQNLKWEFQAPTGALFRNKPERSLEITCHTNMPPCPRHSSAHRHGKQCDPYMWKSSCQALLGNTRKHTHIYRIINWACCKANCTKHCLSVFAASLLICMGQMYRQTTSSFGQPVNLTLQPSPTKHGTLFIVQSVMTWVAYILMLLYTPWKPQISSKHVHAQFHGQNHSRVSPWTVGATLSHLLCQSLSDLIPFLGLLWCNIQGTLSPLHSWPATTST